MRDRWAIFGGVVLIHGALLLLALHWVVRLGVRREDSLVFLVLPNRIAGPLVVSPKRVPPPKKPPAAHDSQLLEVPSPPAASGQRPASVDWKAEADLSVKRQEELAAAPQPRALDRHGKGMDLDGGLNPEHRKKSDFGWDRKHRNRVEVLTGGTLLHLSDHCVLVFFPFPFLFCGIGKIPVRGDLLDHMHDEPQADGKNIAP